MKLRVFNALVMASVFVAPAPAALPDSDACERIKQQIRRVESRMRAGYTAAEGRRLEERLRELKTRRSKLCR